VLLYPGGGLGGSDVAFFNLTSRNFARIHAVVTILAVIMVTGTFLFVGLPVTLCVKYGQGGCRSM
jgi:hypothetical protein